MQTRWKVFPAAVFLALALFFAASASPASSLVVQTESGDVKGLLNGGTKEWRGIPYAAPPLGSLRWRPPAAVAPWSGIRQANAFHEQCLQPNSNGKRIFADGSEDCLYLNVFAPSGASSTSNLAVMVHLHPGGNAFGSPFENASAFTHRDVIVVTVAYRLGIFGWMGHPALTAEGGGETGNYGAFDQLAALRWVQTNIAAFGGNPSNVTLFGSSAGSSDTVALLVSPLSAGLFHRAAVQGEFFHALTGINRDIPNYSEPWGIDMAIAMGCSSAADVLACLRSLPAKALIVAAGDQGISSEAAWGGTLLPRPVLELATERTTVPLLVGFGREEDSGDLYDWDLGAFPNPYTEDDFVRDSDAWLGSASAEKARKVYPPSEYGGSYLWAAVAMRTDSQRGCPTRRLADAISSHAPVYRFLYTHAFETDPFFASFRASHIFEDRLLWHYDVYDFGFALSPAEEALSARMTDYWTNFAKNGDPNGPGLTAWPRYNSSTEPLLTLDDVSSVVTRYHAQQCAVLDKIELPE